VEVLNRCRNLPEHPLGLSLRQVSVVDEVVQFSAGCVLHHHDDLVAALKDFHNLDDVGMPQGGHHLNLLSQSAQVGCIVNLALGNALNGHLLSRVQLDGQFHLAVGAAPEGPDELEAMTEFVPVPMSDNDRRGGDGGGGGG
jgi:hypothetical protein